MSWICCGLVVELQPITRGVATGGISVYIPLKNIKKISNRFVHVWVEMHDEIFHFELFKNFDDNFEIF